MEQQLIEAQNFFVQHRGRLGLSYGILIGAGVMYLHMRSMAKTNDTELVITQEDAERLLEDDSIAVYQTQYGPMFVAMQKDAPTEEG